MSRRGVEIDGTTSKRFARVRDVFAENFRRGEIGAGFAVWHRGQLVVDLWGGIADKRQRTPWGPDTLATVFSSTKGVVALALLMLASRGQLDYDKPVSAYWPEFAQSGKADITVRTLLNHRAGLLTVDTPISLDMLERSDGEVAQHLAAQKPMWHPGSDQGYHGVTFGLYVAELFRRVTGESVGAFLRREVTGPLAADFHVGLPEPLADQVATNYPVPPAEALVTIVPKLFLHRGTEGRVYRKIALRGDTAKAFSNPAEVGPRGIANYNSSRVRRLELPWGNGIGSARGLCRIYSAIAAGGSIDGVDLVDDALVRRVYQRQSWSSRDRVLCKPVGWSQGFLKEGTDVFSPNRESFGHSGSGGSLGWCDPVAGLALGYVMNKMDHHIRSPRALRLCKAVYSCI